MEQKQICCGSVCYRLPTLPLSYPWLVAQNFEAKEDDDKCQIFYTMHDPMSNYRCQIPELLERRIRGCFHEWLILSNHPHNVMWSLWNPITSKTIRLPPLTLKDGDFESISQCCLSSPPNDPTSVLMLTRTKTPTIVFCHLNRKRKRLRWKEMTYAKQLEAMAGKIGFLHCLTCCNGKVYGLISGYCILIQVDIVIKDKELVVNLLPFRRLPITFYNGCNFIKPFLKGYCRELFYISLGFDKVAKKTLGIVYLFKLNWTSMIWEEMEDLKDAIFFVNLAHDCSVFYRHAIASELDGYIHILGDMGKVIYSYNVKDRTISLFSSCCLVQATHVSLWECTLQGDRAEIKYGKLEDEIMVRSVRTEENSDPHLLTIPFDVLKIIMEFCVGVEYLNFRATCKHCQLAAPMIQWSSKTALKRLQKYSLVSPWLVVLDNHQGVITFTDPMFGDKYFITTPQELIGDFQIYCSKFGWLLLFKFGEFGSLWFFNPFTKDTRVVPNMSFCFDCVCFSSPPTSQDCIVVGLSSWLPLHVFISFVNRESSWRMYRMDFGGTTPHSFLFSTFYGEDVYALNKGALEVFREIEKRPFWDGVVVDAPRGRGCSSTQYFLVNCDRHLLLIVMDEFGKFVEVLKLNDCTKEWEKIDSLGRHTIYICSTTCLCIEAKMPEMENKIYFPRLHSKSGKMMFYSLETCRYHTLNGRNIEESLGDFFGTNYYVNPHAWIEPSWS